MDKTIPGQHRTQLGFTEAVLSAFDFLEREYDFHVVNAEPTIVTYESPRVFVNIYHGRASYELGFEIGRLVGLAGQREHPFSLGDLITLAGAQEETGYTFLQASTRERVKVYVPKLADLAKRY